MSRRPARTTQADIARAIRAIEQTGARVRFDVKPDGTISFYPIEEGQPRPPKRGLEPPREIVL